MAAHPAGAVTRKGTASRGVSNSVRTTGRVRPSYPVHVPAGRWPLSSAFAFEATPVAVPRARGHTRQMLQEWGGGAASLAGVTEAAVSELVTNAVEASQALPVALPGQLALLSDRSRVLVMVGDHSHEEPIRADPGPDALQGRGLLLVEHLSARWGWFPSEVRGFAKIVWAEISCPAFPGVEQA
jgi:anti-sigma regulatory factor (Ser/Thr protein kinase)